ncbi:hypothetical protein P8452_40446 [Trifolium repens]|nr:hypothetical protein P8452_40446 [Trifolium repens]
MHPRELLDAERAPAVLNKYLQDMSSLTPAQRREFLEKARRKKEQPDLKVDVLSQLDVGEDKRKRKHDSKENEVAFAELKSLEEEKAGWLSQKDALEIQAGEQYDEGFAFALEQVKILFPDLDPAILGQADAMALVEDGKLIPYVPSQPIPDSVAQESPAAVEDPPVNDSLVDE